MKKIVLTALCGIVLASCQTADIEPEVSNAEESGIVSMDGKKFVFTVKGDFGAAAFTRAYLQADGKEMTDLWVYDYVDGQLVQKLHQTPTDENWGKPEMILPYGQHHVYFVASRGTEPSVNETDHIISWGSVRDTFWKDYEVSVVSTSNGNRAVTLDRVVTKLRLTVNDEVQSACSQMSVTPSVWYYGINYTTGAAVSAQSKEMTVDIPASYVGTSGQLMASFFSISAPDEWTANISVKAKATNGSVLGSVNILGAPFKANRATEYSGNLFGSGGSLNIHINEDWEEPVEVTW